MGQLGKKVHNECHHINDEMCCIVFRVKTGQDKPRKTKVGSVDLI